MKSKLKKIFLVVLLIGGITFLFLTIFGTIAHAVGLVDDTVDPQNLYSKYPLDNYQLDFYVDTNWDWLPWNWKDGIGNQVHYGLFAISNIIWTISLYLSNATGYVIQQAYNLDFISDTANKIGENMQILAGISAKGFSSSGFYAGFLLIFILIIGIHVAYVGLIKRETSKAIQAITNFIIVFLLSAGFIAYAPSYIQKINDFSADVSQASLDLGSKIIFPHSESKAENSVDLIRDTLFSVQVEQPWLLLQFSNSNKGELEESRIDSLLEISPDKNNGKDREEVVKAEIEKYDNQNLTLTKTISRLGMVVFLVLFNFGISIFIFLLTGIMIFSQILFILYAMFLPISFLLSMLPNFTNMGRTALMKLFNTIMLRAGITLIITTAFSISTMFYTLTIGYPFFLIAFLQIVTFSGIYMKLGNILSFFSLQSNDSQQVGRRVLHHPKRYFNRGVKKLQHSINRTLFGGTIGYLAGKKHSSAQKSKMASKSPYTETASEQTIRSSALNTRSYLAGQQIGKVLDSRNRASKYVSNKKQQVKELPYTVNQAMRKSVSDFKQGITDEHTKKPKNSRRPLTQRRSTSGLPTIKSNSSSRTSKVSVSEVPYSSTNRDIRLNGTSPGYQNDSKNNIKSTFNHKHLKTSKEKKIRQSIVNSSKEIRIKRAKVTSQPDSKNIHFKRHRSNK
ncbi:CD3337/EF1877 family mobilome membrane protein [Enterococcus sp. AZ037]|uniref:CD3337/EF1877 family mobilome membrane protein n=1 Tax=Enterococcus sp. AZ037 TaxID=2774924 RepID=UPI003D2FA566